MADILYSDDEREIADAAPYPLYMVKEAALAPEERRAVAVLCKLLRGDAGIDDIAEYIGKEKAAGIIKAVRTGVDTSKVGKFLSDAEKQKTLHALVEILRGFRIKNAERIAGEAIAKTYGNYLLSRLLDDHEIEEIMINGLNEPVFIFHRQHGMCRTNVELKQNEFYSVVSATGMPDNAVIHDARLPDGSRVNVTLPPASLNPLMAIRKFRKKPYTIADLIANGTLSAELAAFLWLCVEGFSLYPLNVLVVGGTASGKTTTLNVLSSFIPLRERLVTIEDTLELNLAGRENGVSLVATERADMAALLKDSLRLRPDRIIIGEVRGAEAETLFTAMNVGHRGALGTLHANSARDAMLRLTTYPMGVPKQMLPLLNVVVVQHRVFDRRMGLVRRITQVAEVSKLDEEIALNEVYAWNPDSDRIARSELPSQAVEKLAEMCGLRKPDVARELVRRQEVVGEIAKGNYTAEEIAGAINGYYSA